MIQIDPALFIFSTNPGDVWQANKSALAIAVKQCHNILD
jgi:hypothetical protein